MKLQMILEVFERLDLEGVQIRDLGHGYRAGKIYYFRDPNLPNSPTYNVTIEELEFDDIMDLMFVNSFVKLLGEVKCYSLFLTTDVNQFQLTKLDNAFFVYGKMLACLVDYCQKFGTPHFIEFSGADKSMDLAYDRLLKSFGRKHKDFAYVPYEDNLKRGVYIKESLLDSLPDDLKNQIGKVVSFTQDERSSRLSGIRSNKNLARPSVWEW